MKTIFLCLFLSLSATITAQEQNPWTPQQKKAKAEYMETINKYKASDVATLPQPARDSFIIATAKNALFPNSLNYPMSGIEKTSIPEGAFLFNKRLYGEPVYTVTFYKDKEKKDPGWTVYVFEKIDEVIIEVHEKDDKFH